jgi:hypothetical protein
MLGKIETRNRDIQPGSLNAVLREYWQREQHEAHTEYERSDSKDSSKFHVLSIYDPLPLG